MRKPVPAFMICGALAACGSPVSTSELYSGYPDTYPLKIVCWGASEQAPGLISTVNYDTDSAVRFCAIKQKDEHIALSIRYRKAPPSQKGMYAALRLTDREGKSHSGVFPMNQQSGYANLYVSDGCVEGSFGGCAKKAGPDMQALMSGLLLIQNWAIQPFQVDVRFLALTPEEFASGSFDPAQATVFPFQVSGL